MDGKYYKAFPFVHGDTTKTEINLDLTKIDTPDTFD